MNFIQQQFAKEIIKKFPACQWVGFRPQSEGFIVPHEIYHQLATYLKEHGFSYLSCLTAVDWIKQDEFELLVYLENWTTNEIVQLSIYVPRDKANIDSITNLWDGAKFMEREVYDLFGIYFNHHKNLKRILSPDDEVHHPLRKDFTIDKNDLYGQETIAKLKT